MNRHQLIVIVYGIIAYLTVSVSPLLHLILVQYLILEKMQGLLNGKHRRLRLVASYCFTDLMLPIYVDALAYGALITLSLIYLQFWNILVISILCLLDLSIYTYALLLLNRTRQLKVKVI